MLRNIAGEEPMRSIRAAEAGVDIAALVLAASSEIASTERGGYSYRLRICSARFSTFIAASFTASLKVGCE